MPSAAILVVDDEPLVLSAVSAALRISGYTVLRAACPRDALDIARQHAGPIDLLVSDVLMPGQTGPAMAEAFREVHPETRFLFMAGLADHPVVRDLIVKRGFAFLPKPFMPFELVAKVRDLLPASPERALSAGI